MATFEEYEVVRLTTDLPDDGLAKGTAGTILNILSSENPIQHYIVEFMDSEGNSLGTPFVPETILERVA